MSLKYLGSLFLSFVFVSTAVHAQEAPQVAATLEDRLQAIEKSQAEIYHTLAERQEAGLATRIAERLTLSGLIEVEAAAERFRPEGGPSESGSDMTLATAFVALGAEIDDRLSASISFLYEQGDTDLEVDEATINYASGVWRARAGQQYLPFGVFNSHFISDPLTLELGETRATALLAGYKNELFSVSGFVFNGNADRIGGENHLDDWGLSLVLSPTEGVSLGGSYLADLADTDAELLGEDDNLWGRRVAAWSAFVVLGGGNFELAGEYLGGVRSFRGGVHDGRRPAAWNVEGMYAVAKNIEVAVRYEGSQDFFDQPKNQYGSSVSWSPREQVSLSVEYLRGTFDHEDRRDLVTAQVAVEF